MIAHDIKWVDIYSMSKNIGLNPKATGVTSRFKLV